MFHNQQIIEISTTSNKNGDNEFDANTNWIMSTHLKLFVAFLAMCCAGRGETQREEHGWAVFETLWLYLILCFETWSTFADSLLRITKQKLTRLELHKPSAGDLEFFHSNLFLLLEHCLRGNKFKIKKKCSIKIWSISVAWENYGNSEN